jgi:hypothetical protein
MAVPIGIDLWFLAKSEEDRMSDLVQFDRRALLKTTTGLLTGLAVAGSPLAAIAGGRAWAIDLASLTSAEGATLLAMTRTIVPHDKLEDAAYAIVVRGIDGEASKDAKVRKLVKDGITTLGASFASGPESERVAALKKIEPSEFFQTMRIKTIQVLYATPMAYAYFGYEGEAFSKGGYLLRGFNDLRWLPEVPGDDGGPLPTGS